MTHEKIIIIDFGSQYTQLIARRVRELNIYSEIYPYNSVPEIDRDVKAVILSGSPFSVRDDNAPIPDLDSIKGKIPLLGVCYGAQYIAKISGGNVLPSKIREYGRANLSYVDNENSLLKDIPSGAQVWMSHGDTISKLPSNFEVIASTKEVKITAYKIAKEDTYAIQFHPEVYHSKYGKKLLQNFLIDISGCSQDWTPSSFIEDNPRLTLLKNRSWFSLVSQ